MVRTCCVLGATGFVGRALVAEMVSLGERPRAASRRPEPAASNEPAASAVDRVSCDLQQPETLRPVLEGVDVVYYLVHSLGRKDFRTIDRLCAHNVAAAAAMSGCRRIIYLGGVAPRGQPSEHLASRLEVGEILRTGSVPAVELRASMIIGNGSASWHIVRDLAARLPFMVLPRWLESRTCPIALADVVGALLDARDVPLTGSAWFDIPGPEVLRARELLEIVADLDGRRIPSVHVPVLTPALSAMWLKLVSGADYSIARELVLGLREDLLPQRSFWSLTQHSPRFTFREAAAAALSSEPPGSRFGRAVERAVHRIGAPKTTTARA